MNFINKEPFNEELDTPDSELYQDQKWRQLVIEKFKLLIDDIKSLQSNPSNENKLLIKEKYKQGLLLCSTIKKLNRISHIKVNKARIKTHEEKNKIDEYHLELQNLLYEISYLKKEINKCLEFRSLHEGIDLVGLEEFYEKAPSELKDESSIKNDEHKLKLAELDWELIQRQNMTARIKDLEKLIDLHEKQVKTKQTKLDSLHPKLSQIIEACKPTLDYFNTNFQEDTMFSETVQYLPKPLYQFYVMISAYKDIDKEISKIEVCGDLEEAKKFNLNDTINLDEDDSGGEEDEEDEAYNKKKKSKSKSSKKKVSLIDRVFSCYPLSCKVTFNCNEYGQFVLEFFYMSILKIITVKSELKLQNNNLFNENSILRSENVFDCLFKNDTGLESPNLANKMLLYNVGVKSIEAHVKPHGLPYRWCQYLCSLYYDNKFDRHSLISDQANTTNIKESTEKNDKTEENHEKIRSDNKSNNHNDTKLFEQIINKLKYRFKSRIALQETLNSLRNQQIPKTQTYSIEKLRFRLQSSIVSFKEIQFDRIATLNFAQNLIHNSEINLTETENAFYELVVKNNLAQLQAIVILNQDYPKSYPLFLININWKHERNNMNDETVRDIERELNIYRDYDYNIDSTDSLAIKSNMNINNEYFDVFAKQINHLLVCFDIYLESESYYLNNTEYQRSKLFTQTVKGRDRKRPYSYVSSMDMFRQRMQFNENCSKN